MVAIMLTLAILASALLSSSTLAAGVRCAQDQPTASGERAERFRCGEQWMNEADANDYHSRLLRWWRMPGDGFIALSTCSRATTAVALRWMEATRPDLERLFGRSPAMSTVILLRSQVQYNAFALTEKEPGRIPPESRGFSAFHHAYLCDSWLDVDRELTAPGAASAYWDASTPAGNQWGPLAVRHAAGLAFAEALDPSPRASAAYRVDPELPFDSTAFWAEKRIPQWLRYGAASYCERYFVEAGVANPTWARAWSLQELEASGGLGDIDEVLRCELSATEVSRSGRLLLQTGLLVAFVLDGECAPVQAAHQSFRRAVQEQSGVAAAAGNLATALKSNEAALREFATPPR